MSVKVEVILRSMYEDGKVEDHVLDSVTLNTRSADDMMQVPRMMIGAALDITTVITVEELAEEQTKNQ